MTSVGLALKPERYDALAVEFIPPQYWTPESELFASKWWDYRTMHPMQATYHFVDAYKRAYKRAYSRRQDSEHAKWLKVFAHDDFTEGAASTRTALWLARQRADKIGCSYDFFCSLAMHYAERRDWTMLPRPQAMYSDKPMFEGDHTISDVVQAAWAKKQQTELMYSTQEFYRVENYCQNPHQRDHQRMLLKRLGSSPNRAPLVATLVFEHRVVFEDAVKQAITDGELLIKRAQRYIV